MCFSALCHIVRFKILFSGRFVTRRHSHELLKMVLKIMSHVVIDVLEVVCIIQSISADFHQSIMGVFSHYVFSENWKNICRVFFAKANCQEYCYCSFIRESVDLRYRYSYSERLSRENVNEMYSRSLKCQSEILTVRD